MSAMDFLFNGQPPPNVSTGGTAGTALPTWYNDYVRQVMARSQALGSAQFSGPQTFEGPRVASRTFDQNQAAQMVRQAVAPGTSALNPAIDATRNAMGATFPQNAQAYMNPFTDQVVNRIADLSRRNVSERLLPAVQDQFISAGQSGSTGQADLTARVLRDANESALAQQGSMLQQGWNDAANIFNSDQNRALSGAQQLSGLATLQQDMGLRGAAALDAVGQQQQQQNQANLDVAFQNFQQQRDAPWLALERQMALLRGTQLPTSSFTNNVGPAPAYSASPLAQFGSLMQTAQGMQQANQQRPPAPPAPAAPFPAPPMRARSGGLIRRRAPRPYEG